jgi:O-antigen/teichoic acid export membrane protein
MAVWGVLVGWFLAEIVAVLLFGVAAFSETPRRTASIEMMSIMAFALPSLAFQFVDVTIQNTDRIILLHLRGLATLGAYDVMLNILFMMSFVSLGVAASLYPVLTRARLRIEERHGGDAPMENIVALLTRYILIMLIPISLIVSLNSRTFLSHLFGMPYADFPDASLVFSILVISYALWGITHAMHTVLRSLGEARFFVFIGITIIAIEIVGCWFLTIQLGLLGTCLIRSIYIFILAFSAYGRLRQHGLNCFTGLGSSFAKIVSASIPPALLVSLLPSMGLIAFTLWLALSLGLYVLLLFLFREVTQLDFHLAKSVLPMYLRGFLEKLQGVYLGSSEES